MNITVTDKALEHIVKSLTKRGKGIGLRLGVRSSGCSGLSYKMEYTDTIEEHDNTLDIGPYKLVVDSKSLPYLEGLVLDYVKEGLNEGFKFNNPNVKDECGCGESFRV